MIYVNGRFLLQEQAGVNRFAYELCLAFVALGIKFTLLCPYGEIKPCYDVSRFHIIRCGLGHSHFWEQIFLPLRFLRIRGTKVLLCFTGIGPILVRDKMMTIHDLAFMVNPQWYTPFYVYLYKLLTPLAAKTSKKILTVSQFSKKEIMRLLAIKEDKIAVIYNAVSSKFKCSQASHFTVTSKEKYILAVSSIDPRKNFQTLLKAFALIKNQDVSLYIIGGKSHVFAKLANDVCQPIPTNKIKWLGRVSDNELKEYYKDAICFIYPSLYEGFGIPPLEAMACGTPTIVSDIEPLREVCGDASLYVNPINEKDIADKIIYLINHPDLQDFLRKAGSERSLEFDWEKSANKLNSLIEYYTA